MKQLQNGRTAICRHYCICVLKVAVSCSVFVDKGSKHTITGNKIRCPGCRLKAGRPLLLYLEIDQQEWLPDKLLFKP